MKRAASEDGNAHVILIVLLILVILGGLGFVGYRALSKKTGTSASSQLPAAASPTMTREVAFDDWGVAVDVPRSSNLYVAKTVTEDGLSSGYDGYDISDIDFDRACVQSQPKEIGSLTRVKADDTVDSYISETPMTNREYFTKNPFDAVVLGDYAYYYIKPNGSYACTDPSLSTGKVADAALGSAKDAFRGSLTSLHLTTK